MRRTAVIVDAYSTGRFLANEMTRYGVECVHVQSAADLAEFFVSGFQPNDFKASYLYSDKTGTAQLLRRHNPFCVIAGSETGVAIADALAEELGTPASDPALSTARRNKHALAEALQNAGVRAIRGARMSDVSSAISWMQRENLTEVVAKPVDSVGTEDVFFCDSSNKLALAAETILGKWNMAGSFNEAFLVQERIRGRQFTVNAVISDSGIYVCETWTYETQDVFGAGSICSHEWLLNGNDPVATQLAEYLGKVAVATGITHGPIHAEIIVDDAGPVAVDIAARMQGSMSPIARLKALGHTHVTVTAQSYCDPSALRAYATGNSPYQRRNHALCVSLISDRSGKVTGQPGLEAIKALPSFADAIGFLGPGKKLTPTRDLISTPGIVYLVSPDRAQINADYVALRAMPMSEIFDLA